MVSNDRAFGLSISRAETGISRRSDPGRRFSSRLYRRDRPVLSQPGDIGKANAQSGDSLASSPSFDFPTDPADGRQINGLARSCRLHPQPAPAATSGLRAEDRWGDDPASPFSRPPLL